jgi:hypothetical protein
MPFDIIRARPLLQAAELQKLFIEELGWEPCNNHVTILINEITFDLTAIAEKKGFVVWLYESPDNNLPNNQLRLRLERKLSETSYEHIIVFLTNDKTRQLWMWVKRESGKPLRPRTFEYIRPQPGDNILTKLQNLYISLEEEEAGLSIIHITHRARRAFDVEGVTKKFYERFKKEHSEFLGFIKGIPIPEDRQWYASVMLNRLMFLYFIQKKGFLDGDPDYLRNRLRLMQERFGRDKFYSFYRYFLLRLFHEGLGKIEHSNELEALIGKVPYINGGIFDIHPIEEKYGNKIQIPDKAFENIFDYFDQYDWILDPERSTRNSTGREEINPDILGYIFEKYINQKQMGAYYTKEDITEYISKNTIIPYIFETAKAKCKVAFENPNGPTVWNLLKENPDRYIFPAVKHGISWDIFTNKPLDKPYPLPEDIEKGLNPHTLHNPIGEVNSINEIETIRLRKEWNKSAPPEYALPTEIWREVISRRKRYEEIRNKLSFGEINDINDLITYNLDIRQFAQDVIANCEGPDLLRALWNAIKGITILDPTCGSGAFLFAALNILEPLYEACLDRMEEMLKDEAGKYEKSSIRFTEHGYPLLHHKKMEDFSYILETVARHPNREYFIFKSIILNNLYGVDIMEEAVEICKLRLFLKLAAQVDPDTRKPNFGIEPLPDIDFNIRAGNTLVGFARYEDVENVVKSKLDFENTMEKITIKAADLQQAFDRFREFQTEGDGTVPPEHKKEIQERLKALKEELNHYLAGEYGVDTKKEKDYTHWLKTHQPFHWFIEFYGIVHEKSGFDVIIGNPPYVEYSKVKSQYTIKGYQTESCGNLYAFVVERSFSIANEQGYIGLIVPIASLSTNNMKSLQNFLYRFPQWHSHYAVRPGKLFEKVDMNLTISIFKKTQKNTKHFITGYRRWVSGKNGDRAFLFTTLTYNLKPEFNNHANLYPKIASYIEASILEKILNSNQKLENFIDPHGVKIYYHSGGRYWRKALYEQLSSHYKAVSFPKSISSIVICLLNSQLFYWYWISNSNCMDVVKREILKLPVFPLENIDNRVFIKLISSLLTNYSKNKTTRSRKGVRIQTEETNFDISKSKPIIDEIDCALARHYGFTEEELDFIVNYDIKYRMGIGGEEEN